jgi:hypothetical protein
LSSEQTRVCESVRVKILTLLAYAIQLERKILLVS